MSKFSRSLRGILRQIIFIAAKRVERKMENLSAFIPFLFWWIIFAIPTYNVLQRCGMSKLHVLWNLIPVLGAVVVLYIIAYSEWPNMTRQPDQAL